MTRHLATLRESQLPPPFYPCLCKFHHIDIQSARQKSQCQHHLRPSQCFCFSMNSGIAPVRSSSELIVQCTGKASKNISCPSVTKRECIRHREASSNFRAAQILRQGRLNPILRANLFPKVTYVCVFWTLPFGMIFLFVCDGVEKWPKR